MTEFNIGDKVRVEYHPLEMSHQATIVGDWLAGQGYLLQFKDGSEGRFDKRHLVLEKAADPADDLSVILLP